MRTIDVDTAARASERAIGAYRRAAADPSLAHESALAIGYIQLRMKRFDAVLPELATAAGSGDPFVRYLAHLFRGRTIEALGGADEAMAAYRAALLEIPNAQSASIALAALLHKAGQADAAIDIMNRSFAARPSEDPWREYGFGQFRQWTRYRDRMREALR
jgi:tetratricopeptide (TPR) repeat protein